MKSITLDAPDGNWLERQCRQQVMRRLQALQNGLLVIHEQGQQWSLGDTNSELRADVIIHDPEAWRSLALNGGLGAGEAYMTGDWSSPDLPAVIRLFSRNQAVLHGIDSGIAQLARHALRLLAWQQRNTEKGARRNIAAHYDLGNDMFQLFLDPTLMYSSAMFPHADATLEQASLFKLDRICQKLQLTPDDHLLEIGTGWGSMAIHAARHYGCRVTTTTISRQQYDLARQRIQDAGLDDRITLLLQDYRQLEGRFDKLVSIEMIEAVGHQYLPRYFNALRQLLKPDGLALIQAITIQDQHYNRAVRNVDFIKRYIFPGGFLPSVTVLHNAMTNASDLRSLHLEDFGPHYAETLRRWRAAFMANRSHLQTMGYNDTFVRMWDYYFAYCEGGFDERVISVVQLLMARPGHRDNGWQAPLLASPQSPGAANG